MTIVKKSYPKLLVVALLVGLSALSAGAYAAPGGVPGRPTNPGGGGGGSGGGGDGGGETPDLGDLFVLYRDTSGVPYLTNDSCQQPLPSETCATVAPSCVLTPGIANGVTTGVNVIPVDAATCAVTANCALCTQEVDFGRTSVVRSPVSVLEQQLDDVVVNLATADCTTLDPAGRLVTSTVTPNVDLSLPDVVTSGAIDSPLQNLAIYRQLMLTGFLGTESAHLDLKDTNFLNTAARGLGAAIDKTGKVSVDTVVYLNQIMGLSDPGTTTVLGDPICINVKEEVKGVV